MDSEEGSNYLKLDKRVEPLSDEQSAPNYVRLRQSNMLHKGNDGSCAIEKLKAYISKNVAGCDLVLCVFVAALKSFKVDQCVRPFPQYFMNENNEKDFVSLRKTCDKIPRLTDFLQLPANNIPKDIVNLLTWLFMESGIPTLKLYPADRLPLSIINEKASINALPQFVFEVTYSLKYEEAWKSRVGLRDIFYAFHGSIICNFFSILKFGLQQHFGRGKEVIFGDGIYLSNEISVCTNYAPFGETWKNSISGHKHSIIAVCEIINDEGNVKCKDKNNKKRSINHNSFGEIPEKYFVVTNSDLVKVKYLLVYRYKTPSVVKSFIKKHLLWIVIFFYLIMLCFIGFFKGPTWRKYVRYLNSLMK